MMFHTPLALLALLCVPVYIWFRARGRARTPVAFSDIGTVRGVPPSFWARVRWIIPAMRCLALVALCVAMARPQKGDEQTRILTEGIAIQMVVDTSSSMSALDFEFDGREADRLEAVKRVFRDFVLGTDQLPGRPDDFVGLVTFARYPDCVCPLTLDHDNLARILDKVSIVVPGSDEDGTALGDGMALGLERLRALGDRPAGAGPEIKSKVMVLLTDGKQTVPDAENPLEVADVAKTLGIKVYTIGAGKPGVSRFPLRDKEGRIVRYHRQASDLDEETLKAVAEKTGGRYFRATDAESLARIYAEIDRLEKTKTEERRYMQYKELYPPLLWLALALVGGEVLLVNTRFRAIP